MYSTPYPDCDVAHFNSITWGLLMCTMSSTNSPSSPFSQTTLMGHAHCTAAPRGMGVSNYVMTKIEKYDRKNTTRIDMFIHAYYYDHHPGVDAVKCRASTPACRASTIVCRLHTIAAYDRMHAVCRLHAAACIPSVTSA